MLKKCFFRSLFLISGLLLISEKSLYSQEQKKCRIAIISLYDSNYKNIGQYSDINKTNYAKKHEYDLFLYHNVLDQSRPGAWSKIRAIQRHLKDYDWIYWSDADSLIMNTDVKLEDIIDDKFNMVISKEVYRGDLNTGSFLIKNCDWSQQLLKEVYEQSQFINHSFWEQAALKHVFQKKPKLLEQVKILQQRALNSSIWPEGPSGLYQQGDFVIHFLGPCNKESLMREWIQKVK